MGHAGLAVLMYHSISDHVGPTAIAPRLFADQMQALDDAGWRIANLSEFTAWRKGEIELPAKTAVLTFDDAFQDFADNAAPELTRRNWSATVFVPTQSVGRRVEWGGVGESQAVLDWPDIRNLAAAGVQFGSHAETHTDLTTMDLAAAREEIVRSKVKLESELGRPAPHFAAPYGATTDAIRAEIARHYDSNVGTRLGRADRSCDRYDAPRIEMHYFRDPQRWRNFLAGDATYLTVRKALRSVGQAVRRLRT